MLVRMMTDAASAPHEQHGDVGDVDHRHPVMAGPARQFEDAKSLRCRLLGPEPWRAGHRAVLVSNVQLQKQLAALGDIFDSPDDIGDGKLAVRIGGRADIDGER